MINIETRLGKIMNTSQMKRLQRLTNYIQYVYTTGANGSQFMFKINKLPSGVVVFQATNLTDTARGVDSLLTFTALVGVNGGVSWAEAENMSVSLIVKGSSHKFR